MNGGLVSIVANASATATRDAEIVTLLNDIKGGKWRNLIEQIRAEYSLAISDGRDPKKAVATLKKKLPGVMWSGQFTSRKKPVAEKLQTHSGFLCADLDDLGEGLSDARAKLVTSPHLLALFCSPTGYGLKAVFCVPADAKKHAASFHAIEKYVHKLTGIKIDGACKDVSRLCFVSFDPDLWFNADAKPLEIVENGETASPIRLNPESCIASSLHDCIPASLHNKANPVLANINARHAALDALAKQNPGLAKLYTEFIEPRFQAHAHARNAFIVQAVPFLYCCVAPQNVLVLVGCFYDCNRALFHDTREQHMKEAKAMLESVVKTYTQSLNTAEREIYDALLGHEQGAFRICRDLALLPEPKREALTFYLSFNHLADRVGIYPVQAQRIMWRLESYGLIKVVKKGTQRAAGVPGVAGTYQWLLQPQPERPAP